MENKTVDINLLMSKISELTHGTYLIVQKPDDSLDITPYTPSIRDANLYQMNRGELIVYFPKAWVSSR